MNYRNKFWRVFAFFLCLAVSLTSASPKVRADAIWDHWKAADAAIAKGNEAGAVLHWQFLVNYYDSVGDWENAALFSGKLDTYFDKIKDYPNAVKYYELENRYWLKNGKDWGAVDLQRAEQLKTTIELYMTGASPETVRANAAPANGTLAKFEPVSGTYIGLYSEQDPSMGNVFSKAEKVYGKKHAIYLAYDQVGRPFPTGYASQAKAAGGALQIAWEPSKGLNSVNDGDYLRKWARDAKASGIPIFLRYASEMNGNWTVWSGNPKLYIEKFRLVAKVMQEEAPNVAMVWSPGDVPRYSMHAYYPGDDAVDWVGVSLYTEPYDNGDLKQPMLMTSPVERLDELYRTYSDRKPMMISETGVSHYSKANDQRFTEWAVLNLSRLYDVMPYKYPRLKAITYFNVDMTSSTTQRGNNNYRLSANEEVKAAYEKLIANPNLLSKVEDGAKPAGGAGYVKADGSSPFNKMTRIVPFVKIPDIYIGRLDYTLNGQLIASQTKPPYGINLDAGSVPTPSALEIAVYNKDGGWAGSRTFPLSSGVSIQIDGAALSMEQPPVIRNGSTLAPVRAVMEALGAQVQWEGPTQTVTASKGDTTLKLSIGKSAMTRNNQSIALEEPAQLVNGFTMIPARAVGEAFGGKVSWNGTSRTVQIATGAKSTAAMPPSRQPEAAHNAYDTFLSKLTAFITRIKNSFLTA